MLVGTAVALSACSPLDVFGPKPNEALLDLARQADADAAAFEREETTAPLAELRKRQADELYAEIERVCGVDDTGLPPKTCRVDREGSAGSVVKPPTVPILTDQAVRTLPEESMELVVAQSIDYIVALGEPGMSDPDSACPDMYEVNWSEADKAAMSDRVEEEYAALYGLDLASAYADDALQARIDALREGHEARLSCITEEMRYAQIDAPAQAPGYEIADTFGEPTDTASASTLIDAIEASLTESWRATAAHADDRVWRNAAIAYAADAYKAANP